MSTIDQQFVEYIVKTLVNNPDKVNVERTIDERGVLLELSVDPEDVGRVIGRRGVTAQSIRTLLRALGTKNDAHYNLRIANDGAERPERVEKPAAEKPAETPAAEPEEIDVVEDDSEEETSDFADKTRADLADLDDLDI